MIVFTYSMVLMTYTSLHMAGICLFLCCCIFISFGTANSDLLFQEGMSQGREHIVQDHIWPRGFQFGSQIPLLAPPRAKCAKCKVQVQLISSMCKD